MPTYIFGPLLSVNSFMCNVRPQIKFLKFLNAGQLRLARKIGVEVMGDSAEDFYAVLERARLEGSSIGSVFAGADDL